MSRLLECKDSIAEYQENTLKKLMQEPYESLLKRPKRERLETPPGLRGLEVAICRKPGELGGVQVSVEIAERSLFIFMAANADGFEKLSNGEVIPFNTSDDPED